MYRGRQNDANPTDFGSYTHLDEKNLQENGKKFIKKIERFLDNNLNNLLLSGQKRGLNTEFDQVLDCLGLVLIDLVRIEDNVPLVGHILDGAEFIIKLKRPLNSKTAKSLSFNKLKPTVNCLCKRLISQVSSGRITTADLTMNISMNIKNAAKAIKNYISVYKVHESEASVSADLKEKLKNAIKRKYTTPESESAPSGASASDTKEKLKNVKKGKYTKEKRISEGKSEHASLVTEKLLVNKETLKSPEEATAVSFGVDSGEPQTQSMYNSPHFLSSDLAITEAKDSPITKGKMASGEEHSQYSIQSINPTLSASLAKTNEEAGTMLYKSRGVLDVVVTSVPLDTSNIVESQYPSNENTIEKFLRNGKTSDSSEGETSFHYVGNSFKTQDSLPYFAELIGIDQCSLEAKDSPVTKDKMASGEHSQHPIQSLNPTSQINEEAAAMLNTSNMSEVVIIPLGELDTEFQGKFTR